MAVGTVGNPEMVNTAKTSSSGVLVGAKHKGEMMTRDKQPRRRLHECDDCHSRRMVSWVELNRAGKPRCNACGSTRLELVSEDAKKDRARLQDERSKGTHGSLKLCGDLESKHKGKCK